MCDERSIDFFSTTIRLFSLTTTGGGQAFVRSPRHASLFRWNQKPMAIPEHMSTRVRPTSRVLKVSLKKENHTLYICGQNWSCYRIPTIANAEVTPTIQQKKGSIL